MQAEYDGRQVVGIDLHRRRSVIVRMTEAGERLDCVRIANDPIVLAAEIAKAGEHPQVVLEATNGWYWAVDVLSDAGAQVHLAHPSGEWMTGSRASACLRQPLRNPATTTTPTYHRRGVRRDALTCPSPNRQTTKGLKPGLDRPHSYMDDTALQTGPDSVPPVASHPELLVDYSSGWVTRRPLRKTACTSRTACRSAIGSPATASRSAS
jgi:hypothetical protein